MTENARMGALLLQFLPFFALVALGWGATRRGWLPLAGIPALNVFVLYFGLPALLFRLGASGALWQPGLGGLALVYGVVGLTITAGAMAWAWRGGLSRLDGGLAALATTFPNTGFLGLPLLTGLLGPQAAGPVAVTIVVDVLLFSSLCLAWAGVGAGPLRSAARNPLLWSMAAGLVCWALGCSWPSPVDQTLGLLAQSATPTSLFTLGAILARAQMNAASAPEAASGRAPLWVPTLLKLLLHPALVWLAGQGALALGVPVTPEGLVALTLAAALPAASNVSMLAERLGGGSAVVARIIWWTTVLALPTLGWWAQALTTP